MGNRVGCVDPVSARSYKHFKTGSLVLRDAVLDDVPGIVEMCMRFHEESPYATKLKASRKAIGRCVTCLIQAGKVIVADRDGDIVGSLGGVVLPHMITGELYATEVWWWVNPDERGQTGLRLFRRFDHWARAEGAVFMHLVAPDDRAARLYQRLGFRMLETVYMRDQEAT